MKKKLLLTAMLSLFLFSSFSQSQNLLSGKYNGDHLKNILIPASSWMPFPKITDRSGWSKADQQMLQGTLKRADSLIDYVWQYIPATKSLLIERTGDRKNGKCERFRSGFRCQEDAGSC